MAEKKLPQRSHARFTRPDWRWQENAACRSFPLYLFFGKDAEPWQEKEKREEMAKEVCGGCSVRSDCLAYAVDRPERFGVWGAMGEDERRGERRRRKRRKSGAA
ncbi:WhiB family transcriptional regulator [Actinomadura sp. LOL_016]|uniref:WhiB family transcriptional regulator n=1 Tax=unclassified Actinomadura TaxID=2626254 RepID=UPI003A809673